MGSSTSSLDPVPPALPEDGVIRLIRGNEVSFGFNVSMEGDALHASGIIEGGLLHQWNLQHPSRTLKCGDRIRSVNGIEPDGTWNSWSIILGEFRKSSVELVLAPSATFDMQPQEFPTPTRLDTLLPADFMDSFLRGVEGACNADVCVICREELEDDGSTVQLPCRHAFHADCVERWLTLCPTFRSARCPACRARLLGEGAGEGSPGASGGADSSAVAAFGGIRAAGLEEGPSKYSQRVIPLMPREMRRTETTGCRCKGLRRARCPLEGDEPPRQPSHHRRAGHGAAAVPRARRGDSAFARAKIPRAISAGAVCVGGVSNGRMETARPNAGFNFLATAALFTAKSSRGMRLNVCTTNVNFTKKVNVLFSCMDPSGMTRIPRPAALLDRSVASGRTVMCSISKFATRLHRGIDDVELGESYQLYFPPTSLQLFDGPYGNIVHQRPVTQIGGTIFKPKLGMTPSKGFAEACYMLWLDGAFITAVESEGSQAFSHMS